MPFKLTNLKFFQDERGSLIPLELNRNLPFDLRGAFYVVNFPKGAIRGRHAHTRIIEAVIALCGVLEVKLLDKAGEHILSLDSPFKGLIVYPVTWIELKSLSENSVFLVCMNDLYDDNEVIKNFEDFINIIHKK